MNTEKTFCPHCGRENPRNYKFCAECGFELPKLNLSDSRRYPQEQPEYSNPQNIHHNGQTKITIIQPKSYGIAILLTFIFGPIGLFYSSVIGGLTMTFMPIILYIVLLIQGQAEIALDLVMIAVLPPIGPIFIGAYWLICIAWAAISIALFNKNARVNYRKKNNAVNTIIGVLIFLFLWFLFVLVIVIYKDNKDKNSLNSKILMFRTYLKC